MLNAVVIAGLSVPAHDRLRKESSQRLVPNGHLFVKPVKDGNYNQEQANAYIKDIYKAILNKIKMKEDEEVSVSLLYVDYKNQSTSQFIWRFFPFAMARPINPLAFEGKVSVNHRNASLNRYQNYLENELSEMIRRTKIVRGFTHIHNLTPLLLPINNFVSDKYKNIMRRLYEKLGTDGDPKALLEREIAAFVKYHPLTRPTGSQHYFSDDIHYFKSPGRHRHGFYRPSRDPGHPEQCLLNARSRLGGSYSHDFHFDCQAKQGALNKHYPNCHNAPCEPKKQHVNIAPNDYIIG